MISDENIEEKITVNFNTRGISFDDLHNLNIISIIYNDRASLQRVK